MASILLRGDSVSVETFLQSADRSHRITLLREPSDAERALYPEISSITDRQPLPTSIDYIVDLEYRVGSNDELPELLSSWTGDSTLLLVNSLTATATAISERLGHRLPVIGFSFIPYLFSTSNLLEVAPSLTCSKESLEQGKLFLSENTGKEIEVMEDRVALVSARTLSLIINEAAFALMEGVSSAADIDVAMKLGTNYPEGPLRWAELIGTGVVVEILQALHLEYGEERYRPCVLLKQFSRAGRPFHAREVAG